MQTAEKIVDFVPEVDSGDHARYARAIKASKKARWDIDADVIRGREFDFGQKFLPDGLSRVGELEFLTESEARLMSQVQGRSYAYIFGLVERFIGAKVLERRASTGWATRWRWRRWCVSPTRSSSTRSCSAGWRDDGGRHAGRVHHGGRSQRRGARGAGQGQLGGAGADLPHRAVHAEPLPAEHRAGGELSPLFKDVFMYHWREECQPRDPRRDRVEA